MSFLNLHVGGADCHQPGGSLLVLRVFSGATGAHAGCPQGALPRAQWLGRRSLQWLDRLTVSHVWATNCVRTVLSISEPSDPLWFQQGGTFGQSISQSFHATFLWFSSDACDALLSRCQRDASRPLDGAAWRQITISRVDESSHGHRLGIPGPISSRSAMC